VGPDELLTGFIAEDQAFHELTRLEGRYLSTEVAGGMTGCVIGIYNVSNLVMLKTWKMEIKPS
jgi:hypothetical protein